MRSIRIYENLWGFSYGLDRTILGSSHIAFYDRPAGAHALGFRVS